MGKYLNEEAKNGLRWIIALWDEKRAKNALLPQDQQKPDEQLVPSFTEYDQDSRSPKANSLASYCVSWTCYSDAVRDARYYDKHRDLLEPAPPKPIQSSGKSIAKGKKAKASTTPQKPPEAPKATEPASTSVQRPKTPPATPQRSSSSSALISRPIFKSSEKAERKDPHATLTQSIGDLIPSDFIPSEASKPAPAPKPAPISKPEVKPEPKPAPKPEPAPVPKPEVKSEPKPTSEVKPEPELKPALEQDQEKIRLINYLPDRIAFISEDFYQSYQAGEIRLGTNYETLPYREGVYAKASVLKANLGQYETDSSEGSIYVPITRSHLEPRLVKDDRVYRFPEPQDGRLLLVEKAVAEAAREDGRDVEDLVFPKKFLRTKNGIILCAELGKL